MKDCDCKLYHTIGCECPCIEPYALVIDIFGWLTTRSEELTIGNSHACGSSADAFKGYIKSRGLNDDIDLVAQLDKIKRG